METAEPLVRIVSLELPSPEIMDVYGVTTPQELLAWFARVSNEANQDNTATGAKLIRRLIRKKEWSPLEMVHVGMEIITTRDIGRQILRHSALRPQEFSQRYAQVNDKPIFRERRLQHPTDRQKSVEPEDNETQRELNELFIRDQQEVWDLAVTKYVSWLSCGVAKECARVFLPEGMTRTRMFFSGSIRHWYHYTQLRVQEETQKEHRQIALACWELILLHFTDLPDHRKEVA